MFVFAVCVLGCLQLHADHSSDCESVLNEEYCWYTFGCKWDGIGCLEQDFFYIEDAACGASGGSLHDVDGVTTFCEQYNTTRRVVYEPTAGYPIDYCSFSEVASGVCPVDNGGGVYCELVQVDPANENVEFCYEYQGTPPPVGGACAVTPPPVECTPCNSGSGCCTGALINTFHCESYCQNSGTQGTCCGKPSTPTTTNTVACGYWADRYPASSGSLRTLCLFSISTGTPDLAACALCDSYYKCCDHDNPATNADICTFWCNATAQASNADCKKRKECLDALGHEPTEAELNACGTTMVRLSSFTVALLLGVIAFFFLEY